jgi:D-glycero-alpha-D-manno-heptose-7-phosphate kinase
VIISRTPFRISFTGGGTDLAEFYRHERGEVLATSINKYMYITVNPRFDHTIRVSYSRTEIVSTVDEIQHPIVREALRLVGIDQGIEITSIADVPAGTGMGSSSSFTVGLLNALYAYQEKHMSADQLARQACDIEIHKLGTPIGKQDQYTVAYGGLQHICFNPDETVFVDPVICATSVKERLEQNLLLFYTGTRRRAEMILTEQKQVTPTKLDHLCRLRDLCQHAKKILLAGEDLRSFGEILHHAWLLKRSMVHSISNATIDGWYERARTAGAIGGKLLGAGGGGFLLLYVEPHQHDAVRRALYDLRELAFQFEPQGSKIIYIGG